MNVECLVNAIGSEFYVGVPDSQLKALCNYLFDRYGIDQRHHIIAANEGNCVAIAAGYHLACGKVPVVYLQNSGEGNIINPVASLLNDNVYAIPIIFMIGWRGEPGIHDEPQHKFQGLITLKLLEAMNIEYCIVGTDATDEDIKKAMCYFRKLLDKGRSVAFVIKKDALIYDNNVKYNNDHIMVREEVIKHIIDVSEDNPVISTTGKASRELFEIREKKGLAHEQDFLTVGSMGHSSSIALGIAMSRQDVKIWCIDGDGAVLMHMGALAVIGTYKPTNMVHIVINNGAHETVGGMPTVARNLNIADIAKNCGYTYAVTVKNYETLDKELLNARNRIGLTMIEAKCSIGSRKNLGRPTTGTIKNKMDFMKHIKKE